MVVPDVIEGIVETAGKSKNVCVEDADEPVLKMFVKSDPYTRNGVAMITPNDEVPGESTLPVLAKFERSAKSLTTSTFKVDVAANVDIVFLVGMIIAANEQADDVRHIHGTG